MKLLIGEGFLSQLERVLYRGGIGLFYNTTWGGVLTYLIIGLILILAAIGLITVIALLFGRRGKTKMSSHEKWLKTGKF